MNESELKSIVEGFIFSSDKALPADRILKLFPETERPEIEDIASALDTLQADYQDRGIELKKVSSGYRFQVKEEFAPWVSRLWDEKPAKYTRALLETLAIIVYRQPITRGEIEEIRGVAVSSYIIKTLVEREWIRVIGQRDVPGRPSLYSSTKQFLDYFNLESLEDLPPLSEIKDIDEIVEALDPEQNEALIAAIKEIQESSKLESIDEESSEVEDSSNELEDSSNTLLTELKASIEEIPVKLIKDAVEELPPSSVDETVVAEEQPITQEARSDDSDELPQTEAPK